MGFATELAADEAGDLWGVTLKQVSILYSQKVGRRHNFSRFPAKTDVDPREWNACNAMVTNQWCWAAEDLLILEHLR